MKVTAPKRIIATLAAAAILLLARTLNSHAQYNYTTLSVPGAEETGAQGISGNNVVGWYQTGNTDYGFLYSGIVTCALISRFGKKNSTAQEKII